MKRSYHVHVRYEPTGDNEITSVNSWEAAIAIADTASINASVVSISHAGLTIWGPWVHPTESSVPT